MKLLKLITSVKTAVFLILLLCIVSIPAAFIPQGLESGEYNSLFGPFLGGFVSGLNYGNFFRSFLFFIPLGLFTVNLAACTAKRLVKQLKGPARNFAPDLIHIGIIILITAGTLSALTKQEGVFYLAQGESLELPSGDRILLEDFSVERYPRGGVKDWISRLVISGPGYPEDEKKVFDLEVNRPLKLGKYRVYQASYTQRGGVLLSGLKIVADPGFPLVLISFVLIGGGLVLYFWRKKT
ncbi:MAG: cytochrome c biogenesis protein ResB [Spirochaetia bacterium]